MITQADVRAHTRVVRAHSQLRQDDCGGSALMMQWLGCRDGGTGQPRARRRRQWDAGHGWEGAGNSNGLRWKLRARLGGGECEMACRPTPSPVFISAAW